MADRWRTPDAGDDDPTGAGATSDAPERSDPRPEGGSTHQGVHARREIPRDLRIPHAPEDLAGDQPRLGEDGLTELGYDLEQRDNNWENAAYKGINSRWVEPHTGELVEVQFHTPTSWRINKTTHDAYEEIENPTTDPSRVDHLKAWRREAVAAIPIPPGAIDIPDYRKDQG